MNSMGKLRRLDFLALAIFSYEIFVALLSQISFCVIRFVLTRIEKHGTANHKINKTWSLPLSDLAATTDLAATSTSIFDTGSSSTAKRIGRRLPPSVRRRGELKRTEPNPNNPQARIELTQPYRRSTAKQQQSVFSLFIFSSSFLPFCYKTHTATILLPRTRVTHCLRVKEENQKPVSTA